MKKILLLVSLAMGSFLTVMADPIDLEKATQLAKTYMPTDTEPILVNGGQSVNVKRRAAAKLSTKTQPYYIFSRGENKGFIVVASDDILPEIIGYTEQGDFDADNMPPALKDYLYGYEVALDKYHAYVQENGIDGLVHLSDISWSVPGENIGPLMTSSWGQGWPYNDFCPKYDGTNLSATGCVATSTSSVIHYWRNDNPRYLLKGTHHYTTWTYHVEAPTRDYAKGYPMKWELMQDSYGGVNYGDWNDHYTSVSDLLCIVGDLVDMDYGPSSGAQSSAQPTALGAFNLHGDNVWYSGVNNMDTWEGWIMDNLEKGRPILYSGYSVDGNNNWAGHAFVLDGCRLSDGLYHFDMGWGDGWKGYWAVDDANGFNTDFSMTHNIYPLRLNLEADISAPTFLANTNNTVMVTVRNNGTIDYTEAVNLFCQTTPNVPTAWGAQQTDWTTIPKGGSDVTLTFTVNPGDGDTWYLIAVDKDFHVLDRIQVPFTATEEEVTSTYITNPSFETYNSGERPTGWTYADGQYSRDAENWVWHAIGHDGARVLDSWQWGDTGQAISQTLTGLAAGTYRLEAKVATDPGNTVTVFAGEQTVTSGAHECGKYYMQSVVIDNIEVVANGSLSIGVQAGSWYKVDDFRLYRYLETPVAKNTNQKPYEGHDYFDITAAMAPWLSTASLEQYTNNGFGKGPEWGNYTGSDGAVVASTFFEKWTGTGKYLDNASLQQTISDLPNGTYYIGGSFIATSQGVGGADVEGVTFWAGDQRIALGTGDASPEIYALEVTVTDGTLTFGVNLDCTTANWVAMDNFFLYWAGTEASYYAQAASSKPVRVPLVVNSRMEDDLANWTITGNLWKQTSTYTNFDPTFMESWVNSNNNLADMSATQSVYLYDGTYALCAAVNAVQQGNTSLSVSGVKLKLGDQSVACHTGNGAPQYFTTPKNAYTAGNYTLGLYVESTDANWVAWDNAFLYCYGAEVEEVTPYEIALQRCQDARDAYETSVSGAATAALAQYKWTDAEYATKTDAEIATAITILNNGATIAEAGQDATSFVVNANLSNTSLNDEAPYGWNMGIKSVEGWSDVWIREQDGANVYNNWHGTINDLEINQTVSSLPNGTYRLSVDLGTDFSGDAADMVAFIVGERVGASEQVSTLNTGAARDFGTYTCATTTTTNSVFFGIRSVGHYIQMKNVHLTFVGGTAAEQETDASYLRQDYFWNSRNAAYVDYTTSSNVSLYGQGVGVRLYPKNKNQVIYAATGTQFSSAQNNVVANGQCLNFVLTDGTPLEVPTAFSAVSATYAREMSSKWGTLQLPYAVATSDAVQYYTLSSVDESTMRFTPAASVPANTPAIFRRLDETAASVSCTAASVAVGKTADAATASDCDGWSLVGSYTAQTVEDANAYYIAQDKFWKTGGSITVNPFRAYFTNTGGSSAKRLAIEVDETPTGIETLNVERLTLNDAAIYDLQGRRIGLPTKGLYIINGKKVLVR